MQRGWFLLAALCCTGEACADVSGTASLLSDYRYRGYSLSNSRPVAQAGLAYDTENGWYAGGLLSGARFGDDTGWEQQAVAYGGYSGRLESGMAWEAGATHASFTASHDYNYSEVFAGVSGRGLSARLYWSPNYYLQGRSSVYGELNAAFPLPGPLFLQAHGGVLRLDPFGHSTSSNRTTQFDVRLGIDWTLSRVTLGVAWTDGSRRPLFTESQDTYGAGSALQVTASYTF